ncbi:ketoacyl-ACP synthase III [Romboutsia maritimum]|uniref:Beta-ketoacyl-[acyl-carrier-protein] synthase III n=1 Tax=Romboutsia maritimum TaxID=2020948 RepID=A0A371ISS5_9FIRM|nr:beta-ketoacyl-ACP synthase III [Romboutsia maritimum]RDY23534.1 ketoacyl-ACP synthase III [Romboutsia maritimum]
MEEIIIEGLGSYVPSRIVTNFEISKIVDTNNEWISDRTGIIQRHISQGEDTSYMASKACENAMKMANISPLDIDLIIVATCTPDMFTPSTACIVQKNIGAKNALAFDISAACTGFIYGLDIASAIMKSNKYTHALVIGAENLSKAIDWNDRSTCVLFADGAGAAVLSKSNDKGIIKSLCKSQGENHEFITIGAKDVENPFLEESVSRNKKLQMNGREVFKFATSKIVECIKQILEDENMTIDDIDYIVPHQANVRIIEYAAKKLNISTEKFYTNIQNYGNTSAASIPIALNEMNEKSLIKKGNKIILVGFGGGLTYGASLINWNI